MVGSDPYLAPEVYDERKYDPQPADIWSLAIIFACMSLRRFPWKAPRLTDNSFKLFVAQPNSTPGGTEAVESSHPGNEESTARSENKNDGNSSTAHDHHHHHHHRQTDTEKKEGGAPNSQEEAATSSTGSSKGEPIKGPWRLLRLLPRETRGLLGHMLQIDPHKRATLADIHNDPWVANAAVCQQLEHGKIQHAGTHHHILEPGSTTPAADSKQ